MTLSIDGSMGEGGGSIVRLSVALAAGLDIPVSLYNIRKKRTSPGLKSQHINAIKAIKQFCGCSVEGLKLGNQSILLGHNGRKKNFASVNVQTAGSVGLICQAALYYSLNRHDDIDLQITGGATHGKWAPSIEYVKHIIFPIVEKMGKKIEITLHRYGFFPKGGAKLSFMFKGHKNLSSLDLREAGDLETVDVYSIASKSLKGREVAERQYKAFVNNTNITIDFSPHIHYVDTICTGTGLTAVGQLSGGGIIGHSVIGERNLTSEEVGKKCSKEWIKIHESKVPIDYHAADQLILPMIFAEGKSTIFTNKITNHTRTNINVVKHFLERNITIKKENRVYSIIVNGDY